MGSHHEPLRALAPLDWDDVPQHDLGTFINDCFGQAQIAIDSVPSAAASVSASASASVSASAATAPAATGRARAKTDSAVLYNQVSASSPRHDADPDDPAPGELSARLRKEWKEVKTNPRDNPLGIHVYKLAGKDGKGSWFARRSVHVGLSFEQWKTGLQREFEESIKVQGAPGSGNIRGIGADRNVEHRDVEDAGHLDVFQLSAQFPGPTAPRDFITLLLTSDFSHQTKTKKQTHGHLLREYMIVSKPCIHPDCPPRQGIIRGQYESVEIIREVPLEADADADADAEAPNKKRSLSSADLWSGDNRKSTAIHRAGHEHDADEVPKAIEWVMITRSDPGGSVPRFLIEKGTPPGIIGDAGKFLDWVTAISAQHGTAQTSQVNDDDNITDQGGREPPELNNTAQNHSSTTSNMTPTRDTQPPTQSGSADHNECAPSSTGLYGIITGAFGVAGAMASGLRSQLGIPSSAPGSRDGLTDGYVVPEEEQDGDGGAGAGADSTSDTSSICSFASALENSITGDNVAVGSLSTYSDESRQKQQRLHPRDKDLRKLLERRQKLDRNYAQFLERMQSKRQGAKQKDAASLAKLREKHDREAAKQEAKYQREMRKLEEKRTYEERKAEARRRKAAERQEKSSLTLALEQARADRDVAVKEMELLRVQVGELQAQNTMLVAKLGRLGALNRKESTSSKETFTRSRA
ncbi:hypothetical protein E4U42_001635 [Claviceps africana]|uniref:DUF3074 domain-containing protein n=1 Tax=Claviceps africana TaxID=83212 RepID=A0A8K0NPK0_9HYPO|nr:hypothetical protein E4U42_001635 [Claviceps africana]